MIKLPFISLEFDNDGRYKCVKVSYSFELDTGKFLSKEIHKFFDSGDIETDCKDCLLFCKQWEQHGLPTMLFIYRSFLHG